MESWTGFRGQVSEAVIPDKESSGDIVGELKGREWLEVERPLGKQLQ